MARNGSCLPSHGNGLLCPDTLSVQGCVTGTEVTMPEDLGVLLAGWDHRPGRFGPSPPTGLREL